MSDQEHGGSRSTDDSDGPPQGRRGDPRYNEALGRGLSILRCFNARRPELTHNEIVQHIGLPKATVSRLLYTLTEVGYLDYNKGRGSYSIGTAVLSLGFVCLNNMTLRNLVQPYMQQLAEYAGSGTLVSLGARDDFSMVYINCSRSAGMISLLHNVGSRVSLARSAMGRAYLAAMAVDEREALIDQIRHRSGDKWPEIERGIRRSIDEIGERGFCLNVGEWQPDINSAAVPLPPTHGEERIFAINCGGPSFAVTPDRLVKELGPRLVHLVQEVRFPLTSM